MAKVVQGGRRFSFTALMVIGDGNGRVGLGYGKAKEVGLAMQKAVDDARKKFHRALAGSTIIHPVLGESGAGRVLLKPAAPGTGVIAAGAARAILEVAGIHDVLAKSLGSSNAINVAHATIAGLKALKHPTTSPACGARAPRKSRPPGCCAPTTSTSPARTSRKRLRDGDQGHPGEVGDRRQAQQRGTLHGLGLRRIGHTNTLPDRPEIRGMIRRVPHLITVEEVAEVAK